ncbi:MAG: hypothetical protein ACE360_05160 [Hyphomicrobiales bacterium]
MKIAVETQNSCWRLLCRHETTKRPNFPKMARASIAASNEVVVTKTLSKPREFWQGYLQLESHENRQRALPHQNGGFRKTVIVAFFARSGLRTGALAFGFIGCHTGKMLVYGKHCGP